MAQQQRSGHRGARDQAKPGQAMILKPKDLNTFLTTQLAGEMDRVLPAHLPITSQGIIGQAVQALRQSEYLQKCSVASIGNSVVYAAQVGLELATPRGLCWLIPYKNQCTYQIGYKGCITLAQRSGKVHVVEMEVVHEGDIFSHRRGSHGDHFEFEKELRKPRGQWYAAFMRVRFTSGPDFIHVMTKEEIEHIRNTSSRSAFDDGGNNPNWTKAPDYVEGKGNLKGPWKDWADEMRKKTVCKNGLKTLGLSAELAFAIGADDQAMATGKQDRIVNVTDWEVVDVKSLPEASASADPQDRSMGGEGKQPAAADGSPDKRWARDFTPDPGKGLSLENFAPGKGEDHQEHVISMFGGLHWIKDRAIKVVGPGPFNRAHLESHLAKWSASVGDFLDQLHELNSAAIEAYNATQQAGNK